MGLLWGCRHRKLSVVQEDGFQYCLQCGKAFVVPPKVRTMRRLAPHELLDIDTHHVELYSMYTHLIVHQKCIRCGKHFNFNRTTGRYTENPSDSQCEIKEQV